MLINGNLKNTTIHSFFFLFSLNYYCIQTVAITPLSFHAFHTHPISLSLSLTHSHCLFLSLFSFTPTARFQTYIQMRSSDQHYCHTAEGNRITQRNLLVTTVGIHTPVMCSKKFSQRLIA